MNRSEKSIRDGGRWLFRVSSSVEVGGGHMTRCLSLAKAMTDTDPTVELVFVLDLAGHAWLEPVRNAGYVSLIEGEELSSNWSGVLMDGYQFSDTDFAYYKTLAGTGPLVFIDESPRPPQLIDLVINIGGFPDVVESPERKSELSGLKYALLGTQYRDMPVSPVAESVQSILISFGRVDSMDATSVALAALATLMKDDAGFTTKIIMGGGAPHLKAVKQAISNFPGPVSLAIDANDMPDQLMKADLIIGGGGVSLLERMAAGVPSVTVVQAENQNSVIVGAAAHGGTINAGPIGSMRIERMAESVAGLMHSRSLREDMALTGRSLVDGYGAERVARHLNGLCASG